uniref:Uncharacterized protein n=1 Tax=Trypanosoma congolense (strain IL3000) TaxID=1068625 RepID=G0UTG6_TRYCI|nr:hypothetical protein, unlikely [Trypanosoma congolense IL3000]
MDVRKSSERCSSDENCREGEIAYVAAVHCQFSFYRTRDVYLAFCYCGWSVERQHMRCFDVYPAVYIYTSFTWLFTVFIGADPLTYHALYRGCDYILGFFLLFWKGRNKRNRERGRRAIV